MVLASALAMLLMTALYVALSTQARQAQAGRELLEEATLARAILTRISADISGQLGPVDPRVLPDYAPVPTLPSEPPSEEESMTEEAGSSGTTTQPPATPPAGGAAKPEMPPAADGGSIGFNFGVRGEPTRLVLSVTRAARGPALRTTAAGGATADAEGAASDLRRITYWMVNGGGEVQGLARQELVRVTGQEADTLPPGGADPVQHILAPEVTSLSFEYFDGASWQASWDGNAPGPDGDTPVGPPAAIAVTITLRRGLATPAGDEPRIATYRHVVALPAANGPADQTLP
jgi:hypothetical protein